MKLMLASDIHGSAYYAKLLLEIFEKEKADKLVLLGDIYNHGPRNPFPKDYNPQEVAGLLNGIKDKLIVVKGNCDSEVDTLISEFDFIENLCLLVDGKSLLCTHGPTYNKDNVPSTKFDAVIYGHFHTGFIERKDGTVFVNAGSISLPKNNTPSSYLIIEDGKIILKDIKGQIIDTTDL